MRRGKRILLVTTSLLLAASGLSAGLWRSRSSQPAPVAAAAPQATSLTAVEADASRVLLHTSGNPVYTSYSPAPDVFVVDLTGTSRQNDLAIPATLPAPLASISAEEAVEMGSTLTRVTFRFSAPVAPQASVADKSVVVSIPQPAPPLVAEAAPAAAAPAAETPHAEVIPDAPVRTAEALPTTEALPPLPRAHSVQRVGTSGEGDAIAVDIAGDGLMSYKAFRLNSPERLVIDLDGVHNGVAKAALEVNSGVVKRVRVAQFKSGAEPVARVVIDLAGKSEYAVTPSGDTLRVTFGSAAAHVPAPPQAPVVKMAEVTAPRNAEPEPVAVAAADIPAQVPTVAQEATWKVPPAPKNARQVINAPEDQTAPATPPRRPPAIGTTTENVFDNTPQQVPAASAVGGFTPGGRTLSGQNRVFNGDPITLNLKDADIKDVLRTFAQLTGLNIAVDPQVAGSVTVDVVDVPWDQVLDLILRQNGLTWTLEGNVMRVGTLDRLTAEAAASARLQEQERLNVPLQTIGFKLSYARAQEVQSLIRDLASPRARIIVDNRTNQLIISEIPAYLQTIRNLIETVDIPSRQVSIEARIVETTKFFNRSWGFQWGFGGVLDPALGNGTGLIFPNRIGYTGGPFNFGGGNTLLDLTFTDVLGTFNLDLALSAAENENLVKVISAPKVTTQDMQPAEIQSGVQIPYQTRVNFTTTVTYIDATLRLTVTPQITVAGTVIMDVAVQKTTPGQPIEGAAGTPLNTRQARTRVMVRDGGTAVIGGIYQASDTRGESRVPVLYQIPVIGNLFKSHSIVTQNDELLIFITPRIVRGS